MARADGSFLTGVLTGALVGASLAMVLAPGSAGDTRALLRAKAREAEDRAQAVEAVVPERT